MTTPTDSEMRALCEAATPGPWDMLEELRLLIENQVDQRLMDHSDKSFIVAARSWIPEALERLDMLRRAMETRRTIDATTIQFFRAPEAIEHFGLGQSTVYSCTPPPPSSGALPEVGDVETGGGGL